MKTLMKWMVLFALLFAAPNLFAQDEEQKKGDVRITKAPKLLNQVEAEYTDEAVKNKIEGPVKLRLTLSATGEVEKVEVLQGLGFGLDEAAAKAAKQFKFSPAEINNVPSQVVFGFTINFSLPILPATLKGSVTDKETGDAIKAKVSIEYVGDEYEEKPSASLSTKPNGTFEFSDIPPGKYKITLEVLGYDPFESQVDLPGGEVSEVGYRLAASADNLVGIVRESGTRKPLPGVKVELWDLQTSKPIFDAFTDGDGKFAFGGVPSEKYSLRFQADGYFTSATGIEVKTGEVTEGTFFLEAEFYDEYSIETKAKRIQTEVTRRRLDLEEIRRIPGTGGDVVRVVQNLPGVARAPALSGQIIVRGSAPQDTQIFVNGDTIPIVFHFLGGPAVINSEMISGLAFFPGNFSTYYGRAIAGVIDLETRSPKTDRLHGVAEVDFLDTTVLIEGPIGEDFSFALSGRRSYFDVFLPFILPDDGPDITVFPRYYDYQAWLHYKGFEDHQLELLFYGSDDKLSLLFSDDDPAGSREVQVPGIDFGTGFHRGQFRWNWTPKLPIENKFLLATGSNLISFDAGSDLLFDLDVFITQLRNDTRIKLSDSFTLRLGLDNQFADGRVQFRVPAFDQTQGDDNPNDGPPNFGDNGATFDDRNNQLFPAFYVEPEIQLFDKKLLMTPGVRVDHYGTNAETSVSPRFAFRWSAVDKVTIKGGAGLFTQPPINGTAEPEFGNPDALAEKALQYSLGTEYKPTEYLEFDVTLWYRDMFDLLNLTDAVRENDDGTVTPVRFDNRGEGRAYGAEVLLRHYPHKRFFGWLAYTLSRSERLNLETNEYDLYEFDQTHILTLVAGYNLPWNIDVSARFRLVTGTPFTPIEGGVYNSDADEYQRIFGRPNSARNATFHQLDLRVDKKFVFKKWILGLYADVLNVYDRRNPEGVRYNYDFTDSEPVQGLPILPTLGVNAKF